MTHGQVPGGVVDRRAVGVIEVKPSGSSVAGAESQ